jgi:hypothetical protein
MTQMKPQEIGKAPVTLDARQSRIVDMFEYALNEARHGRILNLLCVFETPPQDDASSNTVNVMSVLDGPDPKLFVRRVQDVAMQAAEQVFGVPADSSGKRAH